MEFNVVSIVLHDTPPHLSINDCIWPRPSLVISGHKIQRRISKILLISTSKYLNDTIISERVFNIFFMIWGSHRVKY